MFPNESQEGCCCRQHCATEVLNGMLRQSGRAAALAQAEAEAEAEASVVNTGSGPADEQIAALQAAAPGAGERTPGDSAHVALIIEGGGMRGCVSAGMVNTYAQIRAQRVGLKRT